MGKVRRLRKKYHLTKVKEAKSAKNVDDISEPSTGPVVPVISPSENIFAGIDISVNSLTKSLPHDFDTRSIASTKSRKELKLEEQHLKKKVKLKLRRERFLQKLDVTQQAIREAKRKKRRTKKAIIGNVGALQDPPPSLESLSVNKFKKETNKGDEKKRGILKLKKRMKQQTADSKMMQAIFKDKKFKSNPGQTITEYLKQKVAMER